MESRHHDTEDDRRERQLSGEPLWRLEEALDPLARRVREVRLPVGTEVGEKVDKEEGGPPREDAGEGLDVRRGHILLATGSCCSEALPSGRTRRAEMVCRGTYVELPLRLSSMVVLFTPFSYFYSHRKQSLSLHWPTRRHGIS